MAIRVSMRFKILMALLVLVTTVVAIITISMANLFHNDKRTYLHDLAGAAAVQTAEEVKSRLIDYQQKVQVFARLIYKRDLPKKQKTSLISELFEDYPEFVAISVEDPTRGSVTAYDMSQLNALGIKRKQFEQYRKAHPLPLEAIRAGEAYLENSTISNLLPTLTMATTPDIGSGNKPIVVSAIIRLDDLVKLVRRSKIFKTYLIDNHGEILVSSDPDHSEQHQELGWIPDLASLQYQQSAGISKEYNYHGKEMVGGFSQVGYGKLMTATQIPLSAAYLSTRELLINLFIIALILLAGAAILGHIWSNRLTRPIKRLSDATEVLGKGKYNIHVEVSSQDEIGGLASSFNQMVDELQAREHDLIEANNQLVQAAKMAAFGEIGAGIAHEIKNPLAGILGLSQLSMRDVKPDDPVYENITRIEFETKRCKDIIDNLMRFARQEQVQFVPVDINNVIMNAITIVDHQLTINGVKIEQDLADGLPKIMGNGNQIQQIVMNFMINAQQAMADDPGIVKVSTSLAERDQIEIRISDNGPGIPEEIQEKIFQPFFTTKDAGKGTGLGLSVTYGIIKDHMGTVTVESQLGEGATFIVHFPVLVSSESCQDDGKTGLGYLP